MTIKHSVSELSSSSGDLGYNAVLCRYSEIAIKGQNRSDFERMLIDNLHRLTSGITPFRANRERGRIYLYPRKKVAERFSGEDVKVLSDQIKKIFGISSISPAVCVSTDLSAVEAAIDRFFPVLYGKLANQKEGPIRYAMRARRSDPKYPLTSHELELHFAHKLLPAYPRLMVDLTNPELLIQLEVRKDAAYLSFANYSGPGGLPVGSAGRGLALLSGGIDSPVAAYLMMRRGCPLDFITFHSSPYTPEITVSKVACLARKLNEYQGNGRLYCINLLPAQKEIRDHCNPRCRTLLYRRFMLRIACGIARQRSISGLITGDNIGQVASQTMENIHVISEAADRPVHRPILTNDKNETVALARRIGTYDISCRAAPDSCTVFAPRRPLTKSILEKIQAEESVLDIPRLIQACYQESTEMEPETEESRLLGF